MPKTFPPGGDTPGPGTLNEEGAPLVGDWPAFFPPDVPPPDSTEAEGRAYRIVRTIPPTADDFLSSYEQRPTRKFHSMAKACGVSMNRTLEGITRTRARFARGFEGHHIAVGQLEPAFGRVKPTPSEGGEKCHITLWKRVGVKVHLAFAVEAQVPEDPRAV